jgi:hypothetical protein
MSFRFAIPDYSWLDGIAYFILTPALSSTVTRENFCADRCAAYRVQGVKNLTLTLVE